MCPVEVLGFLAESAGFYLDLSPTLPPRAIAPPQSESASRDRELIVHLES